jgi:cytidylate kinase
MKTIIGVSGKIGTGKNYLAQKISTHLRSMGYTTSEGSFAQSLKQELDEIIKFLNASFKNGTDYNSHIADFSKKIKMSQKDIKMLIEIIEKDVKNDSAVNAHSRKKSIRVALQRLGTEVRRSKDEDYWVKAFHKDLPKTDFVLVTDVRFPNEADSIKDKNGIVIRLEIPEEVIAERVQHRDGIQYPEDVKQHPSETSLDDYPRFDLIVGKDFDIDSIIEFIINHKKEK